MQASTTFRIRAALATPSETMETIAGPTPRTPAAGAGPRRPEARRKADPLEREPGDCSGQITVTFTWNQEGDPNSLPPEAVIVKQTSSASWNGDSGTCADGLGDAAVPSTGGETSSGVHYIARSNPGSSFQITVTPSATVSAGGGFQFGPPVGGSCTVTFSAQTYCVRMPLNGVVKIEQSYQILIGQKFSSTISFDPGSPTSAGDTYAWTLSGGDPFADYMAPPPTGPAVYTPFTSPTGASLNCYFANPNQ